MYEGYYDIQCKNLSVVPFQDISTCVNMKQSVRLLPEYTLDSFLTQGCASSLAA